MSKTEFETVHFPTTSNLGDRIKRTEEIILNLNVKSVADIGGVDYFQLCRNNNINYTSLNIEEPQKTGTGGYHKIPNTIIYDGKNIPLETNSQDLVIVNFVLHHTPDNALDLLKQIKGISNKYVLIGEDIAGIDYEMKWHQRNFHHQPGGIFRSDNEWKTIFELYHMKLLKQYIVHRNDDPDPNKIYRCIYLLQIS